MMPDDDEFTVAPGQTVLLKDGNHGLVRYFGGIHVSDGTWVGLEVETGGKNDGSNKDIRYFDCEPGRGLFVRINTVERVLDEPARAPEDILDSPLQTPEGESEDEEQGQGQEHEEDEQDEDDLEPEATR